MKTIIHTINEMKKKDILPNITSGYRFFDICSITCKSVEAALVFFTGKEENKLNFRKSTGAFLADIVGTDWIILISCLIKNSSVILFTIGVLRYVRIPCWVLACEESQAMFGLIAVDSKVLR